MQWYATIDYFGSIRLIRINPSKRFRSNAERIRSFHILEKEKKEETVFLEKKTDSTHMHILLMLGTQFVPYLIPDSSLHVSILPPSNAMQTHNRKRSLFAAGENVLFFSFMFLQNENISADQSIFSRLHIFILFSGRMDKPIVRSLKFFRSSHFIYYIVYYSPVKCVYVVLLLSGNL